MNTKFKQIGCLSVMAISLVLFVLNIFFNENLTSKIYCSISFALVFFSMMLTCTVKCGRVDFSAAERISLIQISLIFMAIVLAIAEISSMAVWYSVFFVLLSLSIASFIILRKNRMKSE